MRKGALGWALPARALSGPSQGPGLLAPACPALPSMRFRPHRHGGLMATGWALQLRPSHPDAVAFSITPDAFSSFYLGRKPSPRTRAGVLAPKLSSTRTGSPSRECSRGWGRGAFGDRPRIRTGRAVSGSSIWNSPTMTRTQSGEGGEAASACCSEGHHVLKSWIRAHRPHTAARWVSGFGAVWAKGGHAPP